MSGTLTIPPFLTTVSATLTMGTLSDTWLVTTAEQDVTPDAFAFTDQTGVARSAQTVSNIVRVTGITGNVSLSIVNGGAYRVCADVTCATNPAFVTASGLIGNGQYLQLQLTSSASFDTSVSTTVTIGTRSDTWSVTTLPDPCAGSPAPGTTCGDGSKFAGYSRDGNGKMYTTVTDAGRFRFAWPETNGYGFTNWTTGEANTLAMAQHSEYLAAAYCANLVAYGKDDWYLPGPYEMKTLYENAAAIGGFNMTPTQGYWTSAEKANSTLGYFYQMNGSTQYTGKGIGMPIRCVRKD